MAVKERLNPVEHEQLIHRSIYDDFLVYKSPSLHHTKYKVLGFMFKKPDKPSLFSFQKQDYYKRHFTISTVWNHIQVRDKATNTKYKQINNEQIICM